MKKIIICAVAFIAVLTANASLATVTNRSSSPTKVETNDKNRTWVEDVKGWNSANGKEATVRIYKTTDYKGELVYEATTKAENGYESNPFYVYITTNPKYKEHYRYWVKTGMVGCYFFNSNKISRSYNKTKSL